MGSVLSARACGPLAPASEGTPLSPLRWKSPWSLAVPVGTGLRCGGGARRSRRTDLQQHRIKEKENAWVGGWV